jgi:hypothetical protein
MMLILKFLINLSISFYVVQVQIKLFPIIMINYNISSIIKYYYHHNINNEIGKVCNFENR